MSQGSLKSFCAFLTQSPPISLFISDFIFTPFLCFHLLRDYHEDYVSPGEDLIFRVNPYYLLYTNDIQIQFDGSDYGTFVVCMARDRNFNNADCQTVSGYEAITFYLFDPCNAVDDCHAAYFRISVDTSLVKCLGLFKSSSIS